MKDILIENFLSKYSKIHNSLQESMKEIARKNFASLNKEEDGHYYILVDGNYEKDFYADSDEEAKKKFQQYLRKNESLSLKESESIRYCSHCDSKVDIDDCDTDSFWTNYGDRVVYHICPVCGESVEDFSLDDGFDEFNYDDDLDESLMEARNPEHEKANKIIRKMCGYGELTDKEIQELKRVGIDPKKMTMDRWNDWQIIGPNGRKLTDMSDSLPRILKKTNNNFDIVGYLTKQHDDKEIDPVDALQPYRKEKEAIKKAGESERKAQERKQRAIQAAKEKHQKKNESLSLNEDWSKGLCFIYKVDTKSLIAACKNNVGMLGTFTPEKYIGDKNQSFRLPKRYTLFTLDRTQVNFDYGQSEITVFWGDEDFTYKEMGGKGNFRKAKLTAEMNDVLESGRKELEDFGIIVNQCKVEVGGSDKFDSTWRQAQDYNESLSLSESSDNRQKLVDRWWKHFDSNPGGLSLVDYLSKLTGKTTDEIYRLNTENSWKKFPTDGFLGYFPTDVIKKAVYVYEGRLPVESLDESLSLTESNGSNIRVIDLVQIIPVDTGVIIKDISRNEKVFTGIVGIDDFKQFKFESVYEIYPLEDYKLCVEIDLSR